MNTTLGTAELLYLDLLKKCLTRSIFDTALQTDSSSLKRPAHKRWPPLRNFLGGFLPPLIGPLPVDSQQRMEGRDWPHQAETMIGMRRLDNLQECVTEILGNQIPGDLIETGVWRGGASIFMRAVLKIYGDASRRVWVADSFQGLPKPNAKQYPADRWNPLWMAPQLAVSMEEVKKNFSRYGLLDDQVCFLPGWFDETLPKVPIEKLAILRLDGDLYESTWCALEALYPKLSPGGYVIVDDYGSMPPCKEAIDTYRAQHRIEGPLQTIDWTGVYWKKGPGA